MIIKVLLVGVGISRVPLPPLHTHASVSLNLFVRPIIAIGKCQGAIVWQVHNQIIHTIVTWLVGWVYDTNSQYILIISKPGEEKKHLE